MAQITDNKQLILHACQVNLEYMRLPAGHLKKYLNIANLYDRLAEQSMRCAAAWIANQEECPDHEPAVDAFWWAAVTWADSFGRAVGADRYEWEKIVVTPHVEFANYLKPDGYRCEPNYCEGTPCNIIMALDVAWMKTVMSLTGQWGWFHHLKDMPALAEAQRLGGELSSDTEAKRAYLKSDLVFFHQLFTPFPLTGVTRNPLDYFVRKAEEELNG